MEVERFETVKKIILNGDDQSDLAGELRDLVEVIRCETLELLKAIKEKRELNAQQVQYRFWLLYEELTGSKCDKPYWVQKN